MALTNETSINIGRGPKAEIAQAIADGKIKAGDFVVTNDEKGNELVVIERDNSQLVVKSRTQNDIQVMGVNLSDGVSNGKTIPAGTDLEDFIKQLVQKRIAATYTQPSVKIANNGGQAAATVEAGTSVNISVKSTFTAGNAGAITKHAITRGGTEVATGTEAELTHSETFVIPDGATTLKSTVTYAEGAIKNDNFGDASPNGHIAAGSKSSSNYTITGARQAFYGAVGAGALPTIDSAMIRGLANKKLNPAAGEALTVTIAEGQQHLVVSLPSTRTLKQVTYVDLGDKGMLEKFTTSTVAVAGASADVATDNSNVYVYSMAAPAAAAMNFELLLA